MRYLPTLAAAALVAVALGATEAKASPCPYTDMVTDWYVRYLNRAPDPGGLHTWVSALRCGADPRDVEAGILASEEYFCRYGHSNPGFVTGLYTDVVGRAPCAHEIEEWMCRLRQIGCRKRLSLEFFAAASQELTGRAIAHRHTPHPPSRLENRTAARIGRLFAPVPTVPVRGERFEGRYVRR